MSETSQIKRQIKLKTDKVKRLLKDQKADHAELEDNTKRVQSLKDSGADDADIRNAERVLDEAKRSIPRTVTLTNQAGEELQQYLDAYSADNEINGLPEYEEAQKMLEQWKASSQ